MEEYQDTGAHAKVNRIYGPILPAGSDSVLQVTLDVTTWMDAGGCYFGALSIITFEDSWRTEDVTGDQKQANMVSILKKRKKILVNSSYPQKKGGGERARQLPTGQLDINT